MTDTNDDEIDFTPMWKCSKCRRMLEEKAFAIDRSNYRGRCYVCRECKKKSYKHRRRQILKRQRRYYYENRGKRLAYQKMYNFQHSIARRLYRQKKKDERNNGEKK